MDAEFSYRWLYRHTQDVGMRNSLSVFTIFGDSDWLFFSFRMLGFDLQVFLLCWAGWPLGWGLITRFCQQYYWRLDAAY